MSDGERQDKPKRRRIAALAGLALVAGLVLGSLGIYVGETRSGNAPETAANCPADAGLARAIDAAAKGEVAAVRPLDEPFDAGGMAFKDAEGATKRIADFSGRTLLMNLWATWCVPCRAEMPALDALERRKGGADFAVLPVNVDLGPPEKPRGFYAEANLRALPFFRDETMGVFNDLKAKGVTIGLPVSLLIDARGCVRAVITGPAEWASPDAFALIDALKAQA